jgi:non-ribosomal peptide synthase protein (TIGR01720 family)
VSRARKAGLKLSPRDVFEHRTVAGLAAVAEEIVEPASPLGIGIVDDGRVRATPIICFLRDLGGPIGRFHQSVVLETPADLMAEELSAALRSIIDHHAMLRARLERSEVGWSLSVGARGTPAMGDVLRRVAAPDGAGLWDSLIRDEAQAAAGRLDPDSGLMVQAVWLDGAGQKAGRLLLLVHHLVVDGVSWRILVPDLAEAWSAQREGRAASLSAVGTSFGHWSHHLHALAAQRGHELELWRSVLSGEDPLLGSRRLDPERDRLSHTRHLTLTLDRAVTEPVLGRVPALFHGQVNDVLLSALALAVESWRRRRYGAGGDGVLIALEGHGREEQAGIDLSGTVGWLTSLYPVRLDPGLMDEEQVWAGGPALGTAVKRIKEQLRALPDNGLGYGLLRYLNEETAVQLRGFAEPQIGFNYLGRFFGGGGGGAWSIAAEAAALGGGGDPQMPVRHVLEVNALTLDDGTGPRLTANWSWVEGILEEEEVRELAADWFRALAALVTHAEAPHAGGLTPSDIPLVALSQEEIDKLVKRLSGAR